METRIFGRLTAWQNWIFQRPNAVGETGALKRYGTGVRADFEPGTRTERTIAMTDAIEIDYDGLIPNNVGLAEDLRVRKALETWHPGYIDWWKEMARKASRTIRSICAPPSASAARAGQSSAS